MSSFMKKIGAIYYDRKGIALFSAMATMVVLFLIGTASLLNTTTESKISQSHRKSVHAFFDCEAGVAEAIAHIKNNTAVLQPASSDPNWIAAADSTHFRYRYYTTYDPNSHIYTVTSEGHDPALASKRRVVAELHRIFSANDIRSPVYCGSGKNKGNANMISGNPVCPGWADDGDPNNDGSVPCVSTHKPYESAKKPLDLDYSQLFTSAPNKVVYNAPELDLAEMANYYKDLPPDRTSIPTASDDNIGSDSATKVVYINGNQLIAGNITGFGILVVTGDLQVSGQLNWQGLVIVLGNNVIMTGGGSIGIHVTGAVLSPNHFEIRGNSDVQWCGDVVKKVMSNAGDPLSVVSWREE
jgi:hypothetical protein